MMTDITSWSEEQATEWAVKEFGEEIAKKFEGKYKLFSLYVCAYIYNRQVRYCYIILLTLILHSYSIDNRLLQ